MCAGFVWLGVASHTLALDIIGAAGLSVIAWVAVGVLRAGLGVSADGVVLRSPLWVRRRVPWSHVENFLIHHRTYGASVRVICSDGRQLSTFALVFENRHTGLQRARAVATELVSVHAQFSASPDTSAPWPDLPKIELADRLTRRAGRAARVLIVTVSIVVVCGAALGLILSGATELSPALRASHGQGIAGAFVATTQSCGRGGCSWSGNFVLANGDTVLHNVGFNGGTSALQAGQTLPALDSGSTYLVFPVHDARTWMTQFFTLLAGILLLAGTIFTAIALIRHERRHQRHYQPLYSVTT
jgi:hypothetical protein